MAGGDVADALGAVLGLCETSLRAVVDSLPYDLFVIDTSGRYVLQNAFCRARWGDLTGLRPRDVATDPQTLEIWERNNQRALGGEATMGEVHFVHAERSGHYFNVIAPIQREGSVVGIVGVNIDVTDHMQSGQAWREAAVTRRALAKRVIAAQEDERRRISRELHDDVGQILVVAKMEAEWLAERATSDEAREVAERLTGRTEQLLARVRKLSHRLRPHALDDLGLDCALATLVNEIARASHISLELEAVTSPDLSTDVETAVYRIAQEALSNIVRHSGAGRAWLQVSIEGDTLRLLVADDGVGISPEVAANASESMGLVGMQERAAAVGGLLQIGRRLGGGTEILLEVPVAPAVDDPAEHI